MGALQVEVDPGEVGLDAGRLERIDRHFARYVDDGRLAGWLALVSRRGKIAHLATAGHRDVGAGLPIETDTLFRIFSMTKPITSVAAMMLYEEGAFELTDPVSRFIGSFAEPRVYLAGPPLAPVTAPARFPIRMWQLLTHTSGLTYGFHYVHPVDAMYRAAGFELGSPPGLDLAGCCDVWASMPLVFEPGTEWNYSVATDVLGRVVEVLSGMPLDRFFAERIFGPLQMNDTSFAVDDDDLGRLATLYTPHRRTGQAFAVPAGATNRPFPFLSGGGGLLSTAGDYHRFTQMLLQGGSLEGTRILGPRTVAYMTRNHLPGGADLEEYGRPLFAETPYDGVGFGLGFSVVEDPAKQKVPASKGEFAWGGAASTAFWVDPVEEITAIFMTQLLPSGTHPIRTQFRQLVAQAIVD